MLLTGTAIGGGLHTLFIAIAGMFPRRGDDLHVWSMFFIYTSAVPVFVLVLVGLLLAPHGSRPAPVGIGMVVGAVASPLLWLAGGAALHGS
ncbi:hypothetical protein [Micromonospora sp. NPDC093277]|uniref:hypothetical protein n=1 Tax=Micromonospora sp. NPDC093277 TaxID=3364291 RepID=UPI0037FEAA79